MNDQAKTNGKLSLAVAGGIGIVGVLAGIAASFFLLTLPGKQTGPTHPGPPTRGANAPVHWKAVINRSSADNSCVQSAGNNFGNVVKYAFPVLARGGDTIMWHGQVDGLPGTKKVHVEFSQSQSPFNSYKFDEDHDSGPVSPDAVSGDNAFVMGQVTVDGVACTSFKDPGVHVDN
jgi:hypothetical protein